MAERAFARVLIAAALLVIVAAGAGPARAAPATPAWSVAYRFSTILYGGTTLEINGDGRYTLAASSMRSPRSERTGTVPAPELAHLAALVANARVETWSTSYNGYSVCAEHVTSLELRRAPAPSVTVSWACGLPGVPADLRAIIAAMRARVAAESPDAQIDTTPSLEAVPVATHDALRLVSGDGRRSVSIDPAGAIVARRRTAAALYPVADCPPRAFGSVDPAVLVKLHALLTPSSDVFAGTTAETFAIFDREMADCPAPLGYGYAAPEYVVPAGTRWIVQSIRNENGRSTTVAIDDAGRMFVNRGNAGEATRTAAPPAAVALLDRLVAAAHDERWPQHFAGVLTCEALLQITHVAPDGTRRNGPPIDGPCDGGSAPPDAAALFRAVGDLHVPEFSAPGR